MSAAALLVVLASGGGPGGGAADVLRVVAAARASSARPADCSPPDGTRESALWRGASAPSRRRGCRLLARAHASLAGNPALAARLARQAREAAPDLAAARIVEARARVATSEPAAALPLFRSSGGKVLPLRAPEALLAFARASRVAGTAGDAARAYRRLVPQAGLLSSRALRHAVYLEAAFAVAATGPTGLDEARGYLRQARRHGALPGLGVWVTVALRVMDGRRSGRGASVAAADDVARLERAAELALRRPTSAPAAGVPWLRQEDAAELVAVGLGTTDTTGAASWWQRAVKHHRAAASPWAEHAARQAGGS